MVSRKHEVMSTPVSLSSRTLCKRSWAKQEARREPRTLWTTVFLLWGNYCRWYRMPIAWTSDQTPTLSYFHSSKWKKGGEKGKKKSFHTTSRKEKTNKQTRKSEKFCFDLGPWQGRNLCLAHGLKKVWTVFPSHKSNVELLTFNVTASEIKQTVSALHK